MSAILDVDLLAFETGTTAARRAVVEGVRESLVTGFVYVGHDLPSGLIDEAYGHLETFFSLPQDVKDRFTVPGTNGQRGYTGLLVETAASSDTPDWKEMLNWGVEVPAGHPLRDRYPHRYGDRVLPEDVVPGITAVLGEFFDELVDLQRRVLRIIAVGIGVDERFFDSMLTDGATLTRAIHYPEMNLAPSQTHVWAGEHADINLITALPRATARGLEVRTEDGWLEAEPPDGHAIINTGLMLERLTNGLIPPGIHRVVGEGSSGDRYSVVQFAHPTPWTMLAPVPSCVTEERPLRYPTVSSSDALDQVLWEINLVEAGRRVG